MAYFQHPEYITFSAIFSDQNLTKIIAGCWWYQRPIHDMICYTTFKISLDQIQDNAFEVLNTY